MKDEQVRKSGRETFEIYEKLIAGLQQSNMRSKLMDVAKQFVHQIKQENVLFNQDQQRGCIQTFDFAFDPFTYKSNQDIEKSQSATKKDVQKVVLSQSVQGQVDPYASQDIRDHQQDIDAIYEYGRYDEPQQNFHGHQIANSFMESEMENMNDDEMMKLAIEMSLNDKQGEEVYHPPQNGSHALDNGDFSMDKQMEEEIPEERKTMEEENSDIIKEFETENDFLNKIQELIEVNLKRIGIITFDIASDFTIAILERLTNCGKQTISNELLIVYILFISFSMKLKTCQTSLTAYSLAKTLYSLISIINPTTLSSQIADETKVILFTVKILLEIIRTPKDITFPQDYSSGKPLITDMKIASASSSSNSQSKQLDSSSHPKLSKSQSQEYQTLRFEFKKQPKFQNFIIHYMIKIIFLPYTLPSPTYFSLYFSLITLSLPAITFLLELKIYFLQNRQYKMFEEQEKVSFADKIYDNLKVMFKHFQGEGSSLRIEYANGEVVKVVSRVSSTPSPSEMISLCFANFDEIPQKMPQLMQMADQIQFGDSMTLLYYLVQLDKNVLGLGNENKWGLLLSEILVSPTTAFIYPKKTEALLKLLMKSTNGYFDIRDRIGLHKEFEIIMRIHQTSDSFKKLSYEQLLVLVQSLQKILNIATSRRQNWLKFCNSKKETIQVIYDAVFNQVKGCVESSLKLISLYYAPSELI